MSLGHSHVGWEHCLKDDNHYSEKDFEIFERKVHVFKLIVYKLIVIIINFGTRIKISFRDEKFEFKFFDSGGF